MGKQKSSLFNRLGGNMALDAAVDIFYKKIMADDTINHFFEGVDMKKQRNKQKAFLAYAFGGPVKYSGKDMQSAHARLVEMGLNEDHFNAVAGHLVATLQELEVSQDMIDEVVEIALSVKDDVLGINNNNDETNLNTTEMAIGKHLKKEGSPDKVKSKESGAAEGAHSVNDSIMMQAMEQAVDAVISIDAEKKITFFNKSAEEMLGYTKDEVMGVNVKKIVPVEHQANHDEYVDANVRTGVNKVVGKGRDLEATRKDGSRFWVNLSLSKVTVGDEVLYTAFIKDIDEEMKRKQDMEVMVTAMNQAVDSVITIDHEKKITFFNPSAEKMFGFTRDEVMGQNVKMIVPIEHQANHDQYVDANVTTGVNKVVGLGRDLLASRKDGSRFWVNLSLSKVEVNGLIQYTAFIKDIDEMMKTTQNMQGMVNAIDTSFAYIEFEPDGTIINANNNMLKTVGYAREEAKGQHHRIFVDAKMAASAEYSQFWADLRAGKIQDGQFKRITKAGEEIWLMAVYSPVKDEDGNVTKVVKIAQDITEERIRNADYQGQIEAVGKAQATIEFGMDGIIQKANDNFLNAMGYSMSEIEGKHHRIFVDDETARSSEYADFWSKLNRGEYVMGEFRRVGKGGKEVWIQASYNPILDLNGEPFKVVKFATDVTELKSFYQELSRIIGNMAQGDLTESFEMSASGDVAIMGDALNTALGNLNKLLENINQIANLVASSAEELLTKGEQMKNTTQEVAAATQQMAEGAQEQAKQTDESSRLIEGVLKSAEEMGKKAEHINSAAERGKKSAADGLNTIKMVVDNMLEIQTSATTTSESITVLTQRSEEIARTLNVITDIAAQTNLLALNAAIEAARAGDAGRGFAVVAEEIRKLAEDSRKSAVDIERVINEVEKDVNSAGKSIEKMELSVKSGNQASKEAEEVFGEIEKTSGETFSFSNEIVSASGQQREAITDTVKNIEKIVVVSEETASGTEQIASSGKDLSQGMNEVTSTSKDLAQVANQLLEGVSKFALKNQGGSARVEKKTIATEKTETTEKSE